MSAIMIRVSGVRVLLQHLEVSSTDAEPLRRIRRGVGLGAGTVFLRVSKTLSRLGLATRLSPPSLSSHHSLLRSVSVASPASSTASSLTSSTTGGRSLRRRGSSLSETSLIPALLPVQRRTKSAKVYLSAPVRVVGIDIGGPHDEEIDVAVRIPVSASCAAIQRGVNRRNHPGVDPIAESTNQLGTHACHLLNGRGKEVIAVQLVEKSATHLVAVDQSMLDEAV